MIQVEGTGFPIPRLIVWSRALRVSLSEMHSCRAHLRFAEDRLKTEAAPHGSLPVTATLG